MKSLASVLLLFAIAITANSAILVNDEKPNATIVISEKPTRSAAFGALELQEHIRLMTGVKLPIATEPDGRLPVRIYVGQSANSPAASEEYADQEYEIRIKGNEIVLNGCDFQNFDKVNYADHSTFPGHWQNHGTTYAVYDFLELLGVRWYLPSKVGITYEACTTLSTPDEYSRRRTPTLKYRDMQGLNIPADLCGDTVAEDACQEALDVRERVLWLLRSRHGGRQKVINHSFDRIYKRFWPEHKEMFGKGHESEPEPPQPCFSSPELLAQVIQDARDYFDGKAKPADLLGGWFTWMQGDCYPVFPRDNNGWCKCEKCQAKIHPTATLGIGKFSNNKASDYYFEFVNKVAAAIKESHPGKIIGCGAYADFCYPPMNMKLEDNVEIVLCVHNRLIYAKEIQQNDDDIINAWAQQMPETPVNMWMYYCFPMMTATAQHNRLFPGFIAEHVKDYFNKYRKLNLVGMFWEPSYLPNSQASCLFDQVEGYINWHLAWDADLDPDLMFDEFFAKYYGPAARQMKDFYRLVQSIYTNPDNYPKGTSHMTESIAWNNLGNQENMDKLAAFMAEAENLALDEPYRERVAIFRKGVWNYMLKGRRRAQMLKKLMASTMKDATVPYVKTDKPGDFLSIDWLKIPGLQMTKGLQSDKPAKNFSFKLAHDGTWLYMVFVQASCETDKLATDRGIVWLNDEWEAYFAKQRGVPYVQFGIDKEGHTAGVSANGTSVDSWKIPGNQWSRVDKENWMVFSAVKLSDLLPGGLKPGEHFFFNLIRSGAGGSALASWIPTFAGYGAPDRFGEFVLEPAAE